MSNFPPDAGKTIFNLNVFTVREQTPPLLDYNIDTDTNVKKNLSDE